MSAIRERLLENQPSNSSIRDRLGIEKSNVSDNSNKKWYQKIFNEGSFSDGYQKGDLLKSTTSTLGDIATDIGEGFLRTAEGVADWGQYAVSDLLNLFGAKKASDAVKKNAQFDSTGAIFGKNKNPRDNFKKDWTKTIEENSLIGEIGDSVFQGVGNVGAMAGLGYLSRGLGASKTVSTLLDSFTSAYGNARSQAYANGANDQEANTSATISGISEAISEQFFDSLPGMKTAGWGDKLVEKVGGAVEKYFGTTTGKIATKVLSNSGEGFEEIISNVLESTGKDIVLLLNKDYKYGMENQTGNFLVDINNAIFSEESLVSFISASLTSAILDGANTYLNEKQKKNLIEAYAKDNNISIEEANEIFSDKVSSDVKVPVESNVATNTNLNDALDIDFINQINAIQNEINKYNSMEKLTSEQQIKLRDLENQLQKLQSNQTTIINSNINLPTVEDIVEQEQTKNDNINKINLPPIELNNSFKEVDLKEEQNKIIQESNPAEDEIHTWIRSAEDIKTFEETLQDPEYKEYFEAGEDFTPDYTVQMAQDALETGKITVYSSYPIEQGIFVTPSQMEAKSYSGDGKIYSKEVDLTDVAWIDPTQGQYAKVDVNSVNNINKSIIPVDIPQITKGNIPIKEELYRKFKNVKEMFENKKNNFDGIVDVNNNIDSILDKYNLNNREEVKKAAIEIFEMFNNGNKTFENNGNKITVSKDGIRECIQVIFDSKEQIKLLKEHLLVFSDLGDIIEKSELISQGPERKNRSNIKAWSYYYDGLNINGDIYSLIFDVREIDSGLNQYRVQRLEKKNSTQGGDVNNNVKILPPSELSSSDNNIQQNDKNVKLPIVNNSNMQNNKNNDTINLPLKKVLNPNEISKLGVDDSNSTPKLPKVKVETGNGESHFYNNITRKTEMLPDNARSLLSTEEDIQFYKKVTNEESLDSAYNRLKNGGKAETYRWIKQESKNATAIDVAEGWILLKQYSDAKDYDSMIEVAKKMREIGTQAGQTVQAFNILSRLTPEGMVKYAQSELTEAYDAMIKNKTKEWIDEHRSDFELKPDEVQFIIDTMKEVSTMEDGYDKKVKIAEIQKLMTDKLPPQKGASIKSWMRISMLFNPKTQVRNVAGNALIAPVNYFGDLFASYADKKISAKTGVRTTGNINVEAILKGFKRGAYEATNDYKKGINTKDMEGNRFEISEGKSFNDKTLIGKNLNRIEALLNYVMDAGDRVFSEASFENSLQNQMILNNTTEITQDMIDIARTESLQRTWNDNNGYTKFVLDVRRGLNKINVNGYGLGDVLIPFAKTPANLTKAIIDYSPAGLISTINKGVQLNRSLTNGQYTPKLQHEFVQNLGKATAGTMLYVLGVALAKAGITSGKSDDDKDTANFLKNTLGINSYSIKIGNKSFTYDWAQPISAPLAITANIVQKEKEGVTLYENILSSLDTAGNILLEQSFLESLNTVFNNNDGVATGIQEAILELPARAIPTFMKQLADLIDGTQRTSFEYNKPLETSINKIKSKIPFLSKSLSPSVDTMGRETKKYGGKNNIFNVLFSPANVNVENISESAGEIYRLYKITGDSTIMPRVAPYYINTNGEKIILNSKQKAEYQKISGNIIEENVSELLNSEMYNALSDIDKADIINKIVNYSYNKAREQVLGLEMSNTYNKINQYVLDGGDVYNYYLNKQEVDYSYENPEKYKTIVQITSYNKYKAYNENISEIKAKYNTADARKNAVINYVNSLELSIPQKAMLIKMNYKSFKSYDNQIIQYINSQDLTISEKTDILTNLGFTVKNGKVYSK